MSAVVAVALVARRGTRRQALALWLFALTPPLVATTARLAGKDVFVARYFTPSSIALALVLGLAAAQPGDARLRRTMTAAGVIVLLGSVPVLGASHRPDGHWGERLDAHRSDIAAATSAAGGISHVWFVAPHDRATLFTQRLDEPWRGAPWWAQARRDGTLWGPASAPAHLTAGTWTIVADTRAPAPTMPPTCAEASRTTEARATSTVLHCR